MDREERLAEVLAAYVERREAGEDVDEQTLIREHPDLSEDLTVHFKAARFVDRALEGLLPAPDVPERIDTFTIDRELGAGGMGTVYAATATENVPGVRAGERVALKVIHPHLLRRTGFFRRFLREAEVGRRVQHENVVRTLFADACMDGPSPAHYLVMEYVEGQTLREFLADVGQAPEDLCIQIARDVTRALVAIHGAGAVHRDIKPDNVLITSDHQVKVMDLGVAQLSDELIRLSQTGAFVGSLHYAAPEQIDDTIDIDGRVDLYALGLLLYELSTGRNPFEGDDVRAVFRRVLEEVPRPLSELNSQTSPFFEELVHTLLRKDRAERFSSAQELLGVLDESESSTWWRERERATRARTARPLRRIRIPRETAVYGRNSELARLRGIYEHAAAGDGQVVLVEGEAGIGKSRLVDEFVVRLVRDGEDVNCLYGGYAPAGAATALGAFATAFREHFGHDGSAAYVPETPLLVPAFDAVLRADAPPEGSEPLTADSLKTVFVNATRNLAAERPTIVLIEDLHFAPEEGRALFASLALAVPGHRVLLIATMRRGVPAAWRTQVECLAHVHHMKPARLSPKDLVELLSETLRSQNLATELGGLVALKSDGNPFFVFELLRGMREGQFLQQHADGTWHTTGVMRQIQVPSSITDLVNARVADLDADERNLLDVAACCGFEFEAELVGAAIEIPRLPTLQAMARIEKRHRLVHAAGRRFVFDHHQVQEVLYSSLPEPLRETYHAAIGDALEQRSGAADGEASDLDGALSVDLCNHFLRGAEGRRALRHLSAAQRFLEESHLHDGLVHLTEQALRVAGLVTGSQRCRLLLRMSNSLDVVGRREAQRAALDEALEVAESAGVPALRASAMSALAWHLIRVSRFDEAEAMARAARIAAERCRARDVEMRALGALGAALMFLGRVEESRGCLERLIEAAREEEDRVLECKAWGNLGLLYLNTGDVTAAESHFRHALDLSRETGCRGAEVRSITNLGVVLREAGRFEEAEEHFARGLRAARELGDRAQEAVATANLGVVAGDLGRVSEHVDRLHRCLEILQAIGDRKGAATILVNLAITMLNLGEFGRARDYQRRALDLSRETGSRLEETRAISVAADLDALEGDPASAERRFGESLALAREIGARDKEVQSLLGRAELFAAEGRTESARSDLEAARRIAHAAGFADFECVAAARGALLPGGDTSSALDVFARTAERLDQKNLREVRLLMWRITGEREHLAEAKRLLDEALANVPAKHHEAMLTNIRENREIVAAARSAGL